jgi:hypothetical protein
MYKHSQSHSSLAAQVLLSLKTKPHASDVFWASHRAWCILSLAQVYPARGIRVLQDDITLPCKRINRIDAGTTESLAAACSRLRVMVPVTGQLLRWVSRSIAIQHQLTTY